MNNEETVRIKCKKVVGGNMKSIKYNRIILDKNIDIKMGEYKDKNGEIHCFVRDKISKAEWKALIFGEYQKEGFRTRKSIIIEGISNDDLLEDDIVYIKDGEKRILGRGIIEKTDYNNDIYKLKLKNLEVHIDNYYYDDIRALFKWADGRIDENQDSKDVYLNGIYKISYYSVYNYFKYFFFQENIDKNGNTNYCMPSNKLRAYCSYMAVRDVLENNGYNVSQLDCFVEGNRWEYDALILKNNVNRNNRMYKEQDVLATIEIKTSGYFSNSKELISRKFEEYMVQEKIKGIPHIYLAINESESCNYYSRTYDVLKNLNKINKNDSYIPIFCKKQVSIDYNVIPEEYDLNKLLKNVKNTI